MTNYTPKTVIVSQRVDEYRDRNETRDAVDQKLVDFLQLAGYLPVPIPNTLVKKKYAGDSTEYWLVADKQDRETGLGNDAVKQLTVWIEAIRPHAIVLSGGNDIGRYVERDLTEAVLLTYAKKNGLPVLGICRGMQMITAWHGKSLKKVSGHVAVRHKVSGIINQEVNSFHEMAIVVPPDNFRVLATSEDGTIEAIECAELSWEGWMWHPERETEFSSSDLDRVRKLFK